jgi:hemoglobin
VITSGLIAAGVEEFYRRVAGDPQILPYFAGKDMAYMKRHQRKLWSILLGVQWSEEGDPLPPLATYLEDSHRHLGISSPHFDRVVGHLQAALVTVGWPADTAVILLDLVSGVRPHVVNERAYRYS